MIRNQEISSIAFRQLVESDRAPVILQVLPGLESGGVEQGVIDMNAAIVKAGGKSIVVSNGGRRVHEIAKAGGGIVSTVRATPSAFGLLQAALAGCAAGRGGGGRTIVFAGLGSVTRTEVIAGTRTGVAV